MGELSPAPFDRRTRRKPFQAILVIRTGSREGVDVEIMRDPDVAHLGMEHPVDDLAVYNRASADAGSHREINKISDTPAGAPTCFSSGGGVHIRVESHRNVERSRDFACQ